MKVYISADIEGVTGITHWNEARKTHADYQEFRELGVASPGVGAPVRGGDPLRQADDGLWGRLLSRCDSGWTTHHSFRDRQLL